jgi:hypothetical protein
MLDAKFSITPNIGNVLSTKFTVTNLTSGAVIDKYIWNYGFENLIYEEKNPIFIFKVPGIFNVTLSAVDVEGNIDTFTQTITADLTLKDSLSFISIPPDYSEPNSKTTIPFKISVISSNPENSLNVDLFSSNSLSVPYQFVNNKWNFLTPTWKFTDLNSNFITTLSVEPTPIYNDNTIVGVSGIGEFYYIDALGNKNNPVTITATLQTSGFNNYYDSFVYQYPSYSNNKIVKKNIDWYVKQKFPTTLKITGNYLDNINKLQWKGIKIPFLITCHDFLTGGIISSYPETNTLGKSFPVNISLTNLIPGQYEVETNPLYFQTTDERGFKTGGYIFTSVTVLTSIEQTSIVAQTSALSGTTVLSFSGESNNFSVMDFENKNQIKRLNESFNNSKYFKDLALPENLNNNTILFDQFFAAAVGTGYLSANEDLGQTVYERIANFTSNHSDIDTCNIEQLISLAEQTNVAADNYGINFPSEIKRMLDIASTPKSKLWGIPDNTPLFPQSIGTELNTRYDFLTAGTKIVLKNKFDGSIDLYMVPMQENSVVYPLSSFLGYGFLQPVLINYLFYNFDPVYSGNYIENVIDWDSESTTLSPNLSAAIDWYGDEGIIEQSFRYFLTKNIFLK